MSVESFLFGKLTAVHPRVYRVRLPQSATLPALTYQRISTGRDYNHGGDDLLPEHRMQVDCWARDPDTADTLATGVTTALSGYADATAQRVFITDDREWDDPETQLFRRIVDVLIAYREV